MNPRLFLIALSVLTPGTAPAKQLLENANGQVVEIRLDLQIDDYRTDATGATSFSATGTLGTHEIGFKFETDGNWKETSLPERTKGKSPKKEFRYFLSGARFERLDERSTILEESIRTLLRYRGDCSIFDETLSARRTSGPINRPSIENLNLTYYGPKHCSFYEISMIIDPAYETLTIYFSIEAFTGGVSEAYVTRRKLNINDEANQAVDTTPVSAPR